MLSRDNAIPSHSQQGGWPAVHVRNRSNLDCNLLQQPRCQHIHSASCSTMDALDEVLGRGVTVATEGGLQVGTHCLSASGKDNQLEFSRSKQCQLCTPTTSISSPP